MFHTYQIGRYLLLTCQLILCFYSNIGYTQHFAVVSKKRFVFLKADSVFEHKCFGLKHRKKLSLRFSTSTNRWNFWIVKDENHKYGSKRYCANTYTSYEDTSPARIHFYCMKIWKTWPGFFSGPLSQNYHY